jgi:ABC-2 type transport system ATP-binding protein
MSAQLDQVTKSYRGRPAVEELTVQLATGVTGILGPNGAGKTTLLRMLATVLSPDSGSIRLLGRSLGTPAERAAVRRHLGYLPQELQYPRGFTAFGFVEYMAALKEWTDPDRRRGEVLRVLDAVQLGEMADRKLRSLSGGQRRRVGIAQALLGDPKLLIMDEPTTGLDPEQRAELRGLLADAGRTGTIVLSTHQTEDVAALCDRVIVMMSGRLLFDGTVADLVGSARGHVWLADSPDPQARASWRTATGQYRTVAEIVPAGTAFVEPSLEDAYLLLVGRAGARALPVVG